MILLRIVLLICISIMILMPSIPGNSSQPMSLERMRLNLVRLDFSIEETKSNIKSIRDVRFLPDLYMALAEFLIEKSRYMYAIKVIETEGAETTTVDFAAEKQPKLEAIEVYDTVIDKFPTYRHRHRALFFKAHELRELGRQEEAMQTYSQLIKEYPESEFWEECHIIMGDYFFEEKKDLGRALSVYRRILDRPAGPFTPLAHYKIAWIYINQNKFSEALLSFEAVLLENLNEDLSLLPEIYRKTDVRRDALVNMVWPYSELDKNQLVKLGRPQRLQVLDYFLSLSPNKSSYEQVLSRLGRRLIIKQRFIEATQVYYELLRITQDLESRIDIIERLYVSMRNSQQSWPVRGFVQEIAQTLPHIAISDQIEESVKTKALHDFEIFARDIATRGQRRARETGDKEDWQWAIRDYQSYLDVFPSNRYANTIRLNLAESHFNAGNYLEAAKAYEHLAFLVRQPKRRKELFDSAIEAYIATFRNQPELSLLELSEARSGLRHVGQHYVRTYPNEKAVPDIYYNMAQTYYEERDFDQSISSLREFINRYPQHQKIQVATHLLLDVYNQKEDYPGLVREGQALLQNKNIREPRLRQQIAQIVEQAQMRNLQAEAGDFSSPEYAANLLRLARRYKGSSLGDKALYESFVAFRSNRDPRAYAAGEQLLMAHSDSQYAQEVVTVMGQMALQTADFRRAALYFELFHERYPGQAEAKELLKSAAEMRKLMGDYKLASRGYLRLGDRLKAAEMDFLAQDWTSLTRSAAQLTDNIKGAYWLGLAQFRLRGMGPAQAALQKASQLPAQDSNEKDMAAHALYLLSQGAMVHYQRVQMRSGREAQAVTEKAARLKALESQLQRVMDYGSGRWTVAALYGLGMAHLEFAQFIRRAPQPEGLSGAQLQEYQSALGAQAASYHQNANQYFRQCVQTAETHEIFTRFVRGCLSQGQVKVNEAEDIRVWTQARESSPPGANEIRRQLFEDSRNPALLRRLAQLYIRSQDYSMAELILNRALEMEPRQAETRASIGVIKLYKNEMTEAKDWFMKALEVQPGNATALWGLAGLYKEFQFQSKLSNILPKARRAGSPRGLVHPMMTQ